LFGSRFGHTFHDFYNGKKLNPKATSVLFSGQKTRGMIRKRYYINILYRMNFLENKQYKQGKKGRDKPWVF
jgi:hypothetical protein